MKKLFALILALILVLSMSVSAFAVTLVELEDVSETSSDEIDVTVVDAEDTLYVYDGGTYYVALEDEAWEDIKITSNGCVDAKLVEYDPETMNVYGMEIVFDITEKGDAMGDPHYFTANGVDESTDKYAEAVEYAESLNEKSEVTYYDVEVRTNVNIVKITVENNYSAHFEEGTIKIEAVLDDVDYAGSLSVINDVIIFEYEEVKWTASSYDDDEVLTVGQGGYSDYITNELGYSVGDDEYDESLLREIEAAAVISTTAFRAIEGDDIKVIVTDEMDVTLYDVAASQKGVNFYGYTYCVWEDEDEDEVFDTNEELTSIEFGFYGDQVVKGEYEINVDLGCDWYDLREWFGIKVEEDDIISYYLVDENGKVVGGKEVDYMTADISENVEFTISGENDKLGQYSLVLEVPASESSSEEENPNTGAESVVGAVAALAVVSAAAAAAVSLKK